MHFAPAKPALWCAMAVRRENPMTKMVLVLVTLLGAVVALDAARADCLMCRCINVSEFGGPPIRASGAFPARGTPECSATCNQFAGRYQVLGRVPENQCPNPVPYTRPYNRGSVAYPGF
jgi:hypothetical protein